MKRYSQLFLTLTVTLVTAWQLPYWYAFFTAGTAKTPFALYSCMAEDFIEFDGSDRRSTGGNSYTQHETDSLLPFFYMRQLAADNRFPGEVCGTAVTPHEVQRTNFNFRSVPADLNAVQTGLYPLFESMSGRVDLAMPDDLFRLTDSGIEFVRMATIRIDAGKSRRFTEALQRKDFRFPARRVAGNPNPKKEYDEGYLLLDAGGRLFHLKQTVGRPFVRAVELPAGLEVKELFLTEFRDRSLLGLLCDAQGRLHVLRAKSYAVVPTELPPFDPARESVTILGNLLDWTVCIRREQADCCYALRAGDFTLIDSVCYPVDRRPVPGLHFTASRHKYVRPEIVW